MNSFAQFIITFCCVSMLFGGLYLLKPSMKSEKTVKYVFSLIFICALVSAISNFKIEDIEFDIKKQSAQSNYTEVTEYTLKLTFEEALRGQNIKFSKITVCTDKNREGGIIISKVTVFSSENPDKIKSVLGGNSAEYEIEVIYE